MQKRSAYLKAMQLDEWVRRDLPDATLLHSQSKPSESVFDKKQQNLTKPTIPVTPSIESPELPIPTTPSAPEPSSAVNAMDWPELIACIQNCQHCGLCQQRTQAVPGVGNQQANWLVIGEAPGEQEDRQGEPFVGRAGLLLNNMLQAIGLERAQIYIANIIKCRPPGNRDPHVDEISACLPYLQRQIALIQPQIILVVGRVAAQTLLETDTPVGRLRGTVHRYTENNIPMVVTYHPAYLLRSPSEKRKSWEDLKLAKQCLQATESP